MSTIRGFVARLTWLGIGIFILLGPATFLNGRVAYALPSQADTICPLPDANPYSDPCQCVHYAWELAAQAGHKLPYWGDAHRWDDGASACGYPLTDAPSPGCVAVWGSSEAGAHPAGHVAWVDAVDGDRFHVSHKNWSASCVLSEGWFSAQEGILFIIVDSEFRGRRIHVVSPGENLLGIAARYETTVTAIVKTNSIRNPDLIGIGQKIVIPESDDPGHNEDPVSTRDAAEVDVSRGGIHTVREGETLSEIAERYGCTTQAIAQLNSLHNMDMISIGQRLRIPQD